MPGLLEIGGQVAVEAVFQGHAERIPGGFFVVNDEEGFHGD